MLATCISSGGAEVGVVVVGGVVVGGVVVVVGGVVVVVGGVVVVVGVETDSSVPLPPQAKRRERQTAVKMFLCIVASVCRFESLYKR